MDENEAIQEQAVATPIFSLYKRGYDPEQVDRYVLDHQRRLDEALHRASESERKLAAAVGQLRELHRRVAVYESEQRSSQPPQLDTLGERVQRILQEAWEGAYNLRQEAERDVSEVRELAQQEVDALRAQAQEEVEELRQVASKEAADTVDEATRRALHIRDETERRRQAYLERVERDREQAIAQITYLYDQRQCAVAELARLQAAVQTTIEEMVRSPLGRPAPGVMTAALDSKAAARPMTLRPEAIEAPPLPGLGTRDETEDIGGPATGPMERFVRPSDREAARAVAKHDPVADADEIERMMRTTQSPPRAPRVPASEPSISVSGIPVSGIPVSGIPVPGAPGAPGASDPTASPGVVSPPSTGPMVRADVAPRVGFEDEDSSRVGRRGVTGAETGGGSRGAEAGSEMGFAEASGPPGQVIPRPDPGVTGLPGESRTSPGGVAHSVQAGIEAAGRILRRPRQQGVYDAEQDGWT